MAAPTRRTPLIFSRSAVQDREERERLSESQIVSPPSPPVRPSPLSFRFGSDEPEVKYPEVESEDDEEEKYPEEEKSSPPRRLKRERSTTPPPLEEDGPAPPPRRQKQLYPAEDVISHVFFGGAGISMKRFIRAIEKRTNLPADQFNFPAYWLYTVQIGQHKVFRPTEQEDPAEMRRFLEWFQQIGYHVVFMWQCINHHREVVHLAPFTLWQIIDNSPGRTRFLQLIQLSYTASIADRGVKDGGRDNVKRAEVQKQKVLQWFRQQTVLVRDEDYDRQDSRARVPAASGLNLLPEDKIPPPPYTEAERLFANKHLLMKWCAQACNITTTTASYRSLDEGRKLVRFEQQLTIASHNAPLARPLPPNWEPVWAKDDDGTWRPSMPLELPNSVYYAAELMPIKGELDLPPAMDFLPRAFQPNPAVQQPAQPMAAASQAVIAAIEQSIDTMDAGVQECYDTAIEFVRSKYPNMWATTAQVERRLLLEGSLRDQIYFSRYVSIIANIDRGLLYRSRLTAIMGDKLGKEWQSLEKYFTLWAKR